MCVGRGATFASSSSVDFFSQDGLGLFFDVPMALGAREIRGRGPALSPRVSFSFHRKPDETSDCLSAGHEVHDKNEIARVFGRGRRSQ